MHPLATDMIVKEIRQRVSEGDCPTISARSAEQLEDVIMELAGRPERLLRTLAEAMKKFAPDLAEQLAERWALAMKDQDARLEAFLAYLRSPQETE